MILKQGEFLIATFQAALSDADLNQLRRGLVAEVVRFRSRGVIVDVTALDVMDSYASRTLREIAQMIRLRGAETVIVGIQPEVAFAMVQLGLTLEGVATALDLEEGLAYLNQRLQSANRGSHRVVWRNPGGHKFGARHSLGTATRARAGAGAWLLSGGFDFHCHRNFRTGSQYCFLCANR